MSEKFEGESFDGVNIPSPEGRITERKVEQRPQPVDIAEALKRKPHNYTAAHPPKPVPGTTGGPFYATQFWWPKP